MRNKDIIWVPGVSGAEENICEYIQLYPGWTNQGISSILHCDPQEVENMRARIQEFDEEQGISHRRIMRAGKRAERRKKKPIPAALRWEVWERDDFTCNICGARQFLEIDHIQPEYFWGKTEAWNLRTLCRKCNRKKSKKLIYHGIGYNL